MIKRTSAAVLVLALAVGCASTPVTSSSGNGGGTTAASLPTLRNAPDYILLSAPNQIRTWDFGNPVGVKGLHIRGISTNVGFRAVGDIQGNGKFCEGGQDWLSLRDLTVHKAGDGTPQAPYILGCASGSTFQPASREIVQ